MATKRKSAATRQSRSAKRVPPNRYKFNGENRYDDNTIASKKPIPWEPTVEKWERHPAEPSKAWKAFRFWRDLDPVERTHEKVIKAVGVSQESMRNWSARFRWTERLRALEMHVDKERASATIARVHKMRDEVATIARNGRLAASTVVNAMAQDILANPERFKGLAPRETVRVLSEVTAALRTLVALEREALGVPATFGIITGDEEKKRAEEGVPLVDGKQPTTMAEALIAVAELRKQKAIDENPGVENEPYDDTDPDEDEG